MQVPDDLRAAMVKRAEVWKGKEWPSSAGDHRARFQTQRESHTV